MAIQREKINHDFASEGRKARALLQRDQQNALARYQQQSSNLLQQIGGGESAYWDTQRRKQLQSDYDRYMVTLGQLGLYGMDTDGDMRTMRSAVDSVLDFQNQFKDENDFNVSYAYPKKYKGKTRTDVNAALTQLKNTPGAEAEYDWLNKNQMNYWSADELKAQIGAWQNEISGIKQQRRNMPRMAAGSTDADYAKRQQEALALSGQIDERKAKIGKAQSLLTRKTYDDEISKWDTQMQKALSDYGKALSVDEDARMEAAMAGNSAFVVQDSDYATNARSTVRDFEKRLRDYGYSDEQINGMRNYALTQQHANEAAQTAQQVAQEAKEHPWMSSALSVGTSMMSGAGFLDIAAQNLLNGTDAFTGQKTAVDRYSKAMMPSSVTNTIRGSISEDMSGVGSFLYNTGMSMADSLATLAIGGVTGLHGAADVILGGAAASQAITDAYDRGATDKQALAIGTLYGTAEALFEHVSLDKLRAFHTASAAGQKTIKTLTQNILKQSFVEGSEEVCTDIANVISDAIVMADKSEISQSIAQYEADGMSEEEATRKAWLDWLGQTGLDFAGGALSGGVLTGADAAVTAGMRSAGYAEAGRQITANDYADILRRAAEESGDENLKKLAGKSATNRNTGKLYEATQDANLTKAVSDRMRALGAESGDVQALSAIVVKQIQGQELTGKEQRAFDASKQARRTANEYTSQFTREADQTTNAWARAATRDALELRRNALDGAARRADSDSTELHRVEKNAAVEVDGEQMQVQALRYNAESERAELTVKGENGSVKQISTQDEKLPEGTRLLAQSAEKYGQTAPQMYAAYQAGQDVERYASAYEVAYAYGHAGVKNYDVLENSGAASYLTPEQRKFAYETGRNAAKAESAAKDAAARSGNISAGSVTLKGGTLGSVRLAAVNTAGLTSKQRASIDVARKVAQAVGVNVVFYESKTDSSGRYIGANGAYRDGTVYLDVNAGKNSVSAGETAILKTMSHELTHFIQQNSGQYEALKAFVAEHVLESGDSIERLAQQKLDNDTTGELTMDGAMDEVVADACEMMLRDSEAVQRLAKENRSLAEKIRDWIGDFVEKVRAAFAGDRATHAEARAMLDRMDALQQLWDDALVDAAKANAGNGATAEGERREQHQNRKKVERDEQKRYNKRSKYSEAETLFLQWANGSSPAGETKQFVRFGKHRFYEKSVNGCVEITASQYAERRGVNNANDYRRAYHRIDAAAHNDGSEEKRDFRDRGSHGNNGDAQEISRQTVGEKLRHDAGGSLSSINRDGGRGKVKEKFSMRDTVEQIRDLVAVHNMTEQNLRGALRLGGLPMPSIAIVKATQGHSMYGPISIVFGRESIDPQTDNRNKIYGGDAYTPTAPAVEYPVDYDRMRTVEKRLAGLSEKIAGGVFRNDSALQRAGVGEESGMSASELADKLSRDDGIRAAYLASQGKTLEPVMQTKEFNRYGNDALAKLVQKIGVQELAGIEASMETGDYQPVREIDDTVRQIIRDSYEEKHSALLNRKPELKEKRLNRFMENNVTLFTVEDFVRDALAYYQDQGATTSEVDRWATSDKLHEAASTEDVKAWLLPQLEGVLGEPGIYNGSERFDKSGNRQSFSQLHWEYTLENIVLAMTETQAARGGQTFGTSAKAMQAVSAEDFRSIDEVKAASGRLGEVDTKQYEDAVQAVEKRIEQVTRAIMRENKPHSDNQFDEMQIIGDVMMQAAQGKRTETAIRMAFSKEGYSISESTSARVREIFRSAAELPTGYFEAKPQRAVGFEEAKAIIVPDNLPADLKRTLTQIGATVREYKAGDESSRLAALNSDDSVKFSERATDPDRGALVDDGTGTPHWNGLSYRAHGGNSPMSRAGYAMFADAPDAIEAYGGDSGQYYAVYKNDFPPIDQFLDGIADAWERAADSRNLPYGLEYLSDTSGEEIADMFDPSDIIDSAAAWDNEELVEWAFDADVFGDARGVNTQDGAIVWDEDYIYKVGSPMRDDAVEAYGDDMPPKKTHGAATGSSKFSERDNTRTERDILADATDGDANTVREMEMLREYKEKLGRYTALTQRLEQQRELAQTAENKDERLRAKNRAENLAAQVSRADEQLMRMQRTEALRTLVAREMKTADSLAKENAALRDRVEYWRGQTRRTKEATTDRKAVEKAARSLIQQTSSNLDVDEVAPRLQELYDGISRGGGEVRYNDIRTQAEEIARDLVSDATAVDDTQYQEYKGLRDYLKKQELVVSEAVKGEIADYADFRKRNMDRMRLKNGETTNIDRVYSELSATYPEFFDQNRESQPSDQLQRMEDVLDAVYSVQEYNPNGRYLREATQSVGNEILEQFFDLPQQKTFADRQAKKLAQQKAEDQNRMNELREAQNAKLQALREQNRQRLADAVARERAKRDDQIAKLKERNAQRNAADRARREESEAVAKYRPRIERKARTLSDWLLKNSDKEHIPEPLKLPVGEFLSAIDFTSKRALDGGEPTAKDAQRAARYTRRLQNLLDSLRQQSKNGVSDMGAYLDIPDGFLDEMQTHIKIANGILEQNPGESPVMMMNGEQLRQLDYLLTVLTKSIQNANKLKANAHFETARQAAQATILQLEKLGEAKGRSSKAGKINAFFQWDNTTPYYAFQRFGEGGKAVFASLADGWDKMAFNTKQVMDFTGQAYTAKEVKAWAKETHDVRLESGKTARMTTAQMMAFYCLSKREQARGHMLGGGVRIGNIEESGKKKNIKQANPYLLTEKDIATVNSALTQRQREVADTLQKYMTEQGSAWGNRVSMERFGYRAFTEENYFPIETLDSNRDQENHNQKETDMFRLLNLSATKSLVDKANNAIAVRDIFDVFSAHMADMAKYDALALPLLDAMKWYNYRETQKHSNGQVETTTVQRSLEQAYGLDANKYFTTFIQDLNGVKEGGRGEGFANAMLSNYKVAAVGANLRVALLQPTAYVRAVGVMDPKYLVKGLGAKSAYKEAEAHSGIALWKQMGFYDTNIGRNIRSQIKQESTVRDMVAEKAMTLAEWEDRLTWGTLWNACKAEVKDKQHLTGDALMEATAKRFREVIYATQVVDSTMTRSQAMRTKDVYASVATAFMSEPTLSYNLVLKAYTDYTTELRETGNRAQAWNNAKGKIVRALATYLVSAAASGLVESIIDARRDDDEYATRWQKYLSALLGAQYEDGKLSGFKALDSNLFSDVDVLSKLPILKEIPSLVQGYSNSRMDTEWLANLVNSFRIWYETIRLSTGGQDAPTDVTYNGNMTLYGKIYNTLKAVSQTVGLPVSAAAREVVTIWNNTVGKVTGKTIRTYDAGPESQIKRAVTDGYLTREKAQELLVEQGIAEDEDAAYWKVDKWATGEGKFDAALDAILSGDRAAYDAQVKELQEHGVGEKALESSVRSQVKEWYQGDEDGKRTVTKEQALKMLQQYGGKDADEAQKLVQQWTCKVVTGTDHDDILAEYTDGNLTASRAVDMWTRYGGMEREDAENKIATADFVKAHPECDGISVEAVQKYNEQAKPAGLDAGTFWEAYQFKNDARTTRDSNGKAISGQGAMDKVAAYIDGLNISSAQKSALFLCFYSQTSLSKIRWSN